MCKFSGLVTQAPLLQLHVHHCNCVNFKFNFFHRVGTSSPPCSLKMGLVDPEVFCVHCYEQFFFLGPSGKNCAPPPRVGCRPPFRPQPVFPNQDLTPKFKKKILMFSISFFSLFCLLSNSKLHQKALHFMLKQQNFAIEEHFWPWRTILISPPIRLRPRCKPPHLTPSPTATENLPRNQVPPP